MWFKRVQFALKQNAQFFFPSLPLTEPPHLRPILRPPPRPQLRPPPPLPFILPPPKDYRKFKSPTMLRTPPSRPPRHLVVPKLEHKMYTEMNKQLILRPKNLMVELTLVTCKNRLVHFPGLDPKYRDMVASRPSIRVHGLRLCFVDNNNDFCYLNHQNQKYLDGRSRIEETEFARSFILDDLRRHYYDYLSIAELASIWYDDSGRNPIDFWIYQFLKHGYCALDDPMPDYASRVGNCSLPLLLPNSSLANSIPDFIVKCRDDLVPDFDFDNFDDCDLETFLLREGFLTNEYHLAEEFRSAVKSFCISTPRLTFFNQEGHTCLHEISLLRTLRDGVSVDHPLAIALGGYFLMRMI